MILFVCTGNTCRSPMAAAAFERELDAERGRVEVRSAGTSAWDGQPASEAAVRVTEAAGLDLSAHRSQRVTPEMLQSAALVLVMEPSHRAALLAMGADPERTHVLSEWPTPGEAERPISDPYGGSIEAYEECWSRIERHVKRVAPHVLETLRARST